MNLSEISTLLNCPCEREITLTGVCIDSRHVKPGNLFIAICGERFDGHDFIKEAVAKGAAAIVCSRPVTDDVAVVQLQVSDTLQALTAIATHHRQTLSCQVIALTGSNGKTTVKEMIAAMLPKPAHATPGNLNNHIGVPLSVLQLQADHRYAVFELGANHPGEIAQTVAIVKPRVTLINNIAPAHIDGFGSIDGVAHAKGEIHQGLAADGTAIINDDDAYADFWTPLLTDKKTLRFSKVKPCTIHARELTFNSQGCAEFILVTPAGESIIKLQVPGAHNVSNALAAASCAHALGIALSDIGAALCQFSGVAGRMTFLVGKNKSIVIDDTYNANLRSVLTALDVLATHQGARIFVFGDMGELGSWTKQHHQEVGIAAREHGIQTVMTCGVYSELTAQAFGPAGKHYTGHAELIEDLLPQLDADTMVLIKGSRAAAMEKIVHQLTDMRHPLNKEYN